MSRVAKKLILIPIGVNVKIHGSTVRVIGNNGELTNSFSNAIEIKQRDNMLFCYPRHNCKNSWAIAGTTRAILYAMIVGVTQGFIKKLQLIGIGYRATVKNNIIDLFLGFSHPINYKLPVGITAECPSQTEIILRGADKKMIGQVAADLHAYRRPDPYKGKGVCYSDKIIRIKEAKKK